ncbi:hypothetical protein BJF79_30735 [Actinomadura sp. CNU-125]|nr:hypothetical protein BJF79_30735 [Actinomadura sp. CNU-125]
MEEYPHQYARTYSLQQRLTGLGCDVAREGNALEVTGPAKTVTVLSRPRPNDDGRLWFEVGGEWLDPADHVVDAGMRIATMVGVGRVEGE